MGDTDDGDEIDKLYEIKYLISFLFDI